MKTDFLIHGIPEFECPKALSIRRTEQKDVVHLTEWITHPELVNYFPMSEPNEIEDSIRRWIGYQKSSLTATINHMPVGIAMLRLQSYKKMSHQSQFGIIVDHRYYKQKIGSNLLKNLMYMAKQNFHIECLHLEVYDDNIAAYCLYKNFGFREFGRQPNWIKDKGRYISRIFMERTI